MFQIGLQELAVFKHNSMIVNQLTSGAVRMIRQPEHARISGVLARHWGNDRFIMPDPSGLLITAASLHDIGWMMWEKNPALNPETGFPYNFMNMPFADHIRIWENGVRLAESVNIFIALMVSRHNLGLLGYTNTEELPEEDAALAFRFRSEQNQKQNEWIARLKADPETVPWVQEENPEVCSSHLSVWDYLSLWACMNLDETIKEETIRAGAFKFDISIRSERIVMNPWPFSASEFITPVETILKDKSVEWKRIRWAGDE